MRRIPQIREPNNDDIIGLYIAERQCEEIPLLHFDQCRAMTLCSFVPCDSAGILLLHDLGANSAAVDDHLAAVDRGFRRKWERIGNIEGAVGGLWKTWSISTSTAAPIA